MRLAAYLDQNGISCAEFGRRLGKHKSTISRYCSLKRVPDSISLLIKIKQMTGGAVGNFEDWVKESEECQTQ